MNRRKFLQWSGLLPVVALTGCTPQEVRRSINSAQSLANGDVSQVLTSNIPSTGMAELDRLVRQQLQTLAERLLKEWGDEKVASPREYVKYTDEYQSRAIVNFESGHIRVETLDMDESKARLEQAIVTTLLTPENPSQVDLLSDKDITTGETPFLLNLVLDHQGQPIRYQWRAQQYAKHLMANHLQQDVYHDNRRYFVEFEMVADHQSGQQHKYAPFVQRNGRRFNIRESLIYAIIEAESSFNPYAMSHIPAFGLMQIVPSSAGRDAHQLLYGRAGTPTQEYLFVPSNNIQMGTAYLSILNDRYLARVRDDKAREYCVIAGYNTGSGNVLRAFDSNRDRAFDRINRMSAQQVYRHLEANLPYQETRRYIQKVTEFEKKYI